MLSLKSAILLGSLAFMSLITRASFAAEPLWWEQEKIRFFWGHSHLFQEAGITNGQLMGSLAKVGATVYVSHTSGVAHPDPVGKQLQDAACAKKHGLHCFGSIYVQTLPPLAERLNAPLAVDSEGRTDPKRPDPFYKPLYEEWLLTPALELAKSGLVDGLHFDWEFYGGRGEGRDVYNDEYFNAFLKSQGMSQNVPVAQRLQWLVDRSLRLEYLRFLRDLTEAMFGDFAAQVRKVNPSFIFSSYDSFNGSLENGGWRSSGIAAGLHSPDAPYFVLDPRHYWDYAAAPWWDSIYSYHHKLGYKHINGSYDLRLFGGRPDTQISATQWMVENSLHSDGYWVWTEREFGTYEWQAFATADRRIKGIEQKVGKFLIRGRQDNHFATTVECSGNPELDRKVKHRTYHLGDDHLAVINNVDSFRPLQVRVRFPSIPSGIRWTVRDPITGLCFSDDGQSTVWNAERLRRGLVFPLEKRSDQFLLLSPARSEVLVPPASLVPTQTGMPLREGFDESANTGEIPGDVSGDDRLLFLKTAWLGNKGPGGGKWVIGSGIFSSGLSSEKATQLRHGNGNHWSPSWSPDRQRILFTQNAHGRGQVFSMNADGSRVARLSKNSYCDKLPVWSPDGSEIAFVSDRDGNWEIYRMNADGSGLRRLTNSPGTDTAPAWSPDGSRIVFESNRDEDTNIYVMNADGAEQRPLVKRAGDDLDPTWSPDSQHIAFTSPNAQVRALAIVDAKTGAVTIPAQDYLTWQVESPRWSPDGRQIAAAFYLAGNSGIALFDLKPDPANETRSGGPTGVVGAKDKQQRTITHKRVINATAIAPRPGGGAHFQPGYPSWYAFGSAAPVHLLKRFHGLSWSADGKSLAFSSDMDPSGAFFVYTMAVDVGSASKPVKIPDSSSAWPQQVVWGQ